MAVSLACSGRVNRARSLDRIPGTFVTAGWQRQRVGFPDDQPAATAHPPWCGWARLERRRHLVGAITTTRQGNPERGLRTGRTDDALKETPCRHGCAGRPRPGHSRTRRRDLLLRWDIDGAGVLLWRAGTGRHHSSSRLCSVAARTMRNRDQLVGRGTGYGPPRHCALERDPRDTHYGVAAGLVPSGCIRLFWR